MACFISESETEKLVREIRELDEDSTEYDKAHSDNESWNKHGRREYVDFLFRDLSEHIKQAIKIQKVPQLIEEYNQMTSAVLEIQTVEPGYIYTDIVRVFDFSCMVSKIICWRIFEAIHEKADIWHVDSVLDEFFSILYDYLNDDNADKYPDVTEPLEIMYQIGIFPEGWEKYFHTNIHESCDTDPEWHRTLCAWADSKKITPVPDAEMAD